MCVQYHGGTQNRGEGPGRGIIHVGGTTSTRGDVHYPTFFMFSNVEDIMTCTCLGSCVGNYSRTCPGRLEIIDGKGAGKEFETFEGVPEKYVSLQRLSNLYCIIMTK